VSIIKNMYPGSTHNIVLQTETAAIQDQIKTKAQVGLKFFCHRLTSQGKAHSGKHAWCVSETRRC